ncbi:hypothetical protein T01_2166 [Trichinella spiralis]|uniref:Uncharacterized protein n=1 Tax=Trichinella spiralis TaxID=6334 RepID=A0A0V1B3V9_TRISP|nr:hypothetical protein T01_2166 [Trichinella spiralis]
MQLALRNRCFRTRSNALLPRGFLDSDEQPITEQCPYNQSATRQSQKWVELLRMSSDQTVKNSENNV